MPRTGLGTLVAAGLTAAISLAGCGGKSTPPSASVTLAEALKLQQAGQDSQAAQLYQQVLAKDPKNYIAHYDLGVIAQSAKNNTEALTDYGQALTVNPSYLPALYNQAVIYTSSDPALAITTYRKILTIDASQSASQLNLGLLEVANGEVAAGIHNLAVAIKENPSYLSHVPASVMARVTKAAAHVVAPTSPATPASSSTP